MYRQEDVKIILDPLIEIPAREHWIYKNPEALTSLMKGIEDAKAARIRELDIDFSDMPSLFGGDVFESYAQNKFSLAFVS